MDYKDLERQVKGGFPGDTQRIENAKKYHRYYKGDFCTDWDAKAEGELKPRRTLPFLQYVVNQIASVNKEQPSRSVNRKKKATEFLQAEYKRNSVNDKFLMAERLSCISEVALIQWAYSGNIKKPMKCHLWPAHNFILIPSPTDSAEVEAIVTIRTPDFLTEVYEYWSADQHITFTSLKAEKNSIPNWEKQIEENPYGMLPFVLCPWQVATMEVWPGSPGITLADAQEYINRRLSRMAAAQEFLCEPVTIVKNSKGKPKGDRPVPGEWIDLEASEVGESGTGPTEAPVSVEHLQPDYKFSEAGWEDLDNYRDALQEYFHIPPCATRMVQSTGRSGDSIREEQWPLAKFKASRVPLWKDIETESAKVFFAIAGYHLSNPEYVKLSEDMKLTVTYPETFTEVPGQERDRANDYDLERGYKSEIQMYAERNGLTEEDAEVHLQKVAEQRRKFRTWQTGLEGSQDVQDAQDDAQGDDDQPVMADAQDDALEQGVNDGEA